ncbi:hypothetical protein D9M68_734090 [compost metagenome]
MQKCGSLGQTFRGYHNPLMDIRTYFILALLVALSAALFENNALSGENAALSKSLADAESSITDLRAAIDEQNNALQQMQAKAVSISTAATDRASRVLNSLPAKVQADRQIRPEPAEVNEWLRELFH